jgi:hypothetical protein
MMQASPSCSNDTALHATPHAVLLWATCLGAGDVTEQWALRPAVLSAACGCETGDGQARVAQVTVHVTPRTTAV